MTWSGMPAGVSRAKSHSVSTATTGPVGARPSEMRAASRCRLKISRIWSASSAICSCHRDGSGGGSSASAMTRSKTSWSSSSLFRMCQ